MIGLELYGPLSMRAERGCAGVGGAGEEGRAWGCVSSDFSTHLKASSLSLPSFSPSFMFSSSFSKSAFVCSSCFTSRLKEEPEIFQRH